MNKIHEWVNTVLIVVVFIFVLVLVGGNQSAPKAGDTTNYDQLSLDSTSLPQLVIGSSTPITNGSVVVDGTGTTTMVMMSSTSGKGSCIQMESTAGSPVAVYVSGTTVTATAGTCR